MAFLAQEQDLNIIYRDFYVRLLTLNPLLHNVEKMAKHTLKILRCEHRKIFKVCLAIFQRYAIKG